MGEEKTSSSSSGPSAIGLTTGIASIAAGAYHGYCDAMGIPFEKENLEFALTYGPTIVQGGMSAALLGITGFVGGGAIGTMATSERYRSSALEKIAGGSAGAAIGTLGGAAVGGILGGGRGAIQTIMGYTGGYLTGWMLR